MADENADSVDAVLPKPRLAILGLQHVLVMYAGAIAVPLIIGNALKLSPQQVAMLISADLFCCGIATLIQSWGATPWFGIRLPVMMGVSFAAVGPMMGIAIAMPGAEGARTIFGAVIAVGVIGVLTAPLISRLLRFFPPVVTGSITTSIGVSLMPIGIGWAMGGMPFKAKVPSPEFAEAVAAAKAAGTALPTGPAPMVANPDYAALGNLGIAMLVLAAILLIAKFGRGFISNVAVLLGIVFGAILATLSGKMSFANVSNASWFELVTPLSFGTPIFDPLLIASMAVVMIAIMVESTGMFLALSEITGRKLAPGSLTAGLRADGLGTLIGGLFNTFPYTSFVQNIGLVGITGVRSRFVCVASGIILLALGLIPKMGALIGSLPTFVLGGAGLVMFGMVVATGIRMLATVDYGKSNNNLYVVALSIGVGIVPMAAPDWTQHMAPALRPLLESSILLTAITAIALNIFFNGAGRKSSVPEVSPT